MNASLTVYQQTVFDFINEDFEIETLLDDCLFTEGPLWNKEGFYLFSDIPANSIYKIVPGNKKQIYLINSGSADTFNLHLNSNQTGSNGLAYNIDGGLLICQHGGHGIAIYKGEKIQPFINSYKSKPLNSPNDLVVHSTGKIYFSDPPYGLKDGKLNSETFQPVAGVYCWQNRELTIVCQTYSYPNGVCLTPDEKAVYICSNKPFEKYISEYDIATHAFKKIFSEENSDGIKCDRKGNVYLCNKDGIIVLDKEGKRLALLSLPAIPSNICWGGEHLNDLFITARENIFLIRHLQK